MIEPAIKESIVCVAKAHACRRVILFGSRAKNTEHSRSDIDIAVWGSGDASWFLDLKEALEQKVPTLLRLDVINMESHNISGALRSEIRKDGIVLYEEV